MTVDVQQNDIEMVERIINRDPDALTDLYNCYGARIYAMALQVTGQTQAAEDVTQDVFFQIWRWPERWDPNRGRFISWVLTVTRYTAIDQMRREQRQPEAHQAPDEFPGSDGDMESWDDVAKRDQRVRDVLRRLPLEQRKVILMAFFRGMTHTEIAQQLDLPVGTVKSRIRLGMQKLKAHITEDSLIEFAAS